MCAIACMTVVWWYGSAAVVMALAITGYDQRRIRRIAVQAAHRARWWGTSRQSRASAGSTR